MMILRLILDTLISLLYGEKQELKTHAVPDYINKEDWNIETSKDP